MRYATSVAGAVPAVHGILTEAEIRATGETIAAGQQESGAIGWPDGLVDAWNHVECAMALSVCGLSGPARRAYEWLLATQRADGSWPRRTAPDGRASDDVGESNHAAYVAVGVWHEYQVTGDAAGVIHSFAVPSFGIKIDAIPGRLNETWFKALHEGIYYGQCSELCGRDHAFMPIAVRVVSEADFAAWVEQAKKKFARDDVAPPTALAAVPAAAE